MRVEMNIGILFILQDEMESHNCVKELRSALQASNNKVTNIQIQVTDLKTQLKEQEREVGACDSLCCKILYM